MNLECIFTNEILSRMSLNINLFSFKLKQVTLFHFHSIYI